MQYLLYLLNVKSDFNIFFYSEVEYDGQIGLSLFVSLIYI